MLWEYWKYEHNESREFQLQAAGLPAPMSVPDDNEESQPMLLVAPPFEAETFEEAKEIANTLSGITTFLEEEEKKERHEYYLKRKNQ